MGIGGDVIAADEFDLAAGNLAMGVARRNAMVVVDLESMLGP
jgi:hypothetical protein